MDRRRARCNLNGSLVQNGTRRPKRFKVPLDMKARLKVDFSDPVSNKAIRLVRDAGCTLTTIPVSAQPFPELLVNGQYYRGLNQIREAVAKITKTQD